MTTPNDNPTQPPVILSLSAASRRYGVPRSTLIQWIDSGKLTRLYDGYERVVIAEEVANRAAERLRDRPQVGDVLGAYVRGEELEAEEPAEGD